MHNGKRSNGLQLSCSCNMRHLPCQNLTIRVRYIGCPLAGAMISAFPIQNRVPVLCSAGVFPDRPLLRAALFVALQGCLQGLLAINQSIARPRNIPWATTCKLPDLGAEIKIFVSTSAEVSKISFAVPATQKKSNYMMVTAPQLKLARWKDVYE